MSALVPRNGSPIRLARGVTLAATPRAEIVPTGRGNTVPGSNGIPILTVKVVDYAGQDPAEAEHQVWQDWTRRYPGALVQVVHGDAWEVLV